LLSSHAGGRYDPEVASPESTAGGVEKPPQPRAARGRFTQIISREIIEDIDQALRAGGSMETAAGFAGVSAATFRQWLVDGRRAEQLPRPQPEAVSLKVDLVEAVEGALADFKLSLTGGIFQHGRDSWQAWAWLAERRFPDEFGRRQRIEHANPEGESFRVQPMMFDPTKLTDEELESMREMLLKAAPAGRDIEAPLRVIEGG
jgi:hypothetical protein